MEYFADEPDAAPDFDDPAARERRRGCACLMSGR